VTYDFSEESSLFSCLLAPPMIYRKSYERLIYDRGRGSSAPQLQEFWGVLPLMDLSSLWVKSCHFAAGALHFGFPPADDYSKSQLRRKEKIRSRSFRVRVNTGGH